jgi:purine-binding chemotaxis protein CheW
MNTTSNKAAGHEILVFALGAEAYGIDILKVQEIRGYEKVTQVANAPAHIKGVVNLRGVIVPIVDMRILLNVGRADYTAQTVVIILNLGSRVVGMVVDSVSDVKTLTADQISPAPQMGGSLATQYLTGIGTIDDHLVILMDIEKLMAAEGFAAEELLAA